MKNKKPWYKKWWVITLIVFFGIGIIGNLGEKNIPNSTTHKELKQGDGVVFDVAALYGKDIDEIRSIFGTPADGSYIEPTKEQLQFGTQEWSNSFKRDQYELLVTFNVNTRKVIDFFLPTNDSSGLTKDVRVLEDSLNVYHSDDFIVEPVKAIKDPSYFTGIKVTPK